jgi:heat-inducible transcriptional repressor
VASKTLAADPDLRAGPSTIRNELALLEEHGLLAHPHTSAGRVPTDAGYRYFVDRLLPVRQVSLELSLIRREIDDAMRATTETLSQVTNLLAIVTAPPVETASIKHVEVLLLQPQVVMVVVITSTGGVTKRVLPFEEPVDAGLVSWAGEYLNEQLRGIGLGARMLAKRLDDPELNATERRFVAQLAPAFTELAETAESSLYVDGAARLLAEHRVQDLSQINALMGMLEQRVTLLGALAVALASPDVLVRIGAENELPELRSLAMVAAGYGLPSRRLGAVSLVGPVRMDYGTAISTVREASRQLSRFVSDVYES